MTLRDRWSLGIRISTQAYKKSRTRTWTQTRTNSLCEIVAVKSKMDGHGSKWMIHRGWTGRFMRLKLNGHGSYRTVKRLKVNGLRKLTVLKSKSGWSLRSGRFLKEKTWTVNRNGTGRPKGKKLDSLKRSNGRLKRMKLNVRLHKSIHTSTFSRKDRPLPPVTVHFGSKGLQFGPRLPIIARPSTLDFNSGKKELFW